jgi:hypothetical protein
VQGLVGVATDSGDIVQDTLGLEVVSAISEERCVAAVGRFGPQGVRKTSQHGDDQNDPDDTTHGDSGCAAALRAIDLLFAAGRAIKCARTLAAITTGPSRDAGVAVPRAALAGP